MPGLAIKRETDATKELIPFSVEDGVVSGGSLIYYGNDKLILTNTESHTEKIHKASRIKLRVRIQSSKNN